MNPPRVPGSRKLTGPLSVFWLLLIGVLAAAISNAQSGLTTALVEQRLTALRDAGSAEDSEIVALYSAAREQLIRQETFERDAANYIDAMTAAPTEEAEIQARIDVLAEDPAPPLDLAGLDREQLEARLVIARNELDEATLHLEDLNQQLAARESNVSEVRQRLAEIQLALNGLSMVQLSIDPAAPPSLAEGQEWLDAATFQALGAERRSLNASLESQPARYSAMRAQQAEAELNRESLSRAVNDIEEKLRGMVLARLDAESLGIESGNPAYGLATGLAQSDTALRRARIEGNQRLADTSAMIEQIDRQSRALKQRFATARRVVDFAAESEVLGSLLLAYWEELDSFKIDNPTADLSREAASAVVRRIEGEEELKSLSSASAFINGRLAEAGIERDQLSQKSFDALVDLVSAYRDRLRAHIDAESDYIDALGTLRESYLAFSLLAREYESFLKGRILWIPAYPALWHASGGAPPLELAALREYAATVGIAHRLPIAFGALVFVLLYLRRHQFKASQHAMNRQVARPRDDDIRFTFWAMLLLALRVMPLPVLLAGLGMALTPPGLSNLVNTVAISLFLLLAYRRACEPGGLARVHFKWHEMRTANIYRDLARLVSVWIPLAALTGFLSLATSGVGEAIIARVAMIILVILPIAPITGVLLRNARSHPRQWVRRVGNQFRLFIIAALAATAVAVAIGHVYSVTVIFDALLNTLWVALLLLLLHALLMRWLSVTRRRLRLAALLEARSQDEESSDMPVEDTEASISNVSAETGEFINVGIAVLAIASLVYIWSPLLPALDVLKEITLWTTTSTVDGQAVDSPISLAMLLLVLLLAGLTLYGARKLPALIDLALRSRTGVSASSRYTVSTLLNYLIIGTGTIAALSALGLKWSQLQWLVAALGVGIGFGLQEIIANFISGLIILFERPIRIGDVVSTGDKDGVVTRIRIRATTIRDWDGKELLVPNKEFITGRLLNWSLSDPKVRIVLPVGIAYGSDVELAIRALYEIVQDHPRVVDDPEPLVAFESFGDNALSLSARAYLDSLEGRINVISELNRSIYKRFDELGIVIAFPQRDIHLDPEKPIRIALEPAPGSTT